MEIPDALSAVLKNKDSQIWSISPDESVLDAIQQMADRNVGALLVLEEGQLVGIISERDYTRKVILQGKSSKDTQVREIMITEVVTAEPGDSVVGSMKTMTEKHIRHLPILGEGGEVIGIVSIGDLVKWVVSAQNVLIEQLENYITGSYPG